MSAAVDQYIQRVDGTPCMKTKIHLTRGIENHVFLTRRANLLIFLKGTEKDKKDLKKKNPTLFGYFSEIWEVRNNHMDESLPINYTFMLKCCGKKGCPHPLCIKASSELPLSDSINSSKKTYCVCGGPEEKERFMISCDQCGAWFHGNCVNITEEAGMLMEETNVAFVCPKCKEAGIKDLPVAAKWFPEGPSFSMFPYPVVDETRKAEDTCQTCVKTCSGHYVTDLAKYMALYSEGKAIRSHPPSQIIQEYHKNWKNEDLDPPQADIDKLAKKCLLLPEEVKIWLDHLKQVARNRKKGAEKAKATRQKKLMAKTK